MKKLFGIFFAVLIFAAPLAMRAEIEATAGSMKIGVHMDLTYRWSAEDNKHPEEDEIGWMGYDTISAGDLMIQVTGKVGDRISYKILEGLVYGTFTPFGGENMLTIVATPETSESIGGEGPKLLADGDGGIGGSLLVKPLEAYVDFQIVDQLKARFGKTVIPTLIANTGVHKADVIHTANPPLIANRILGFNELMINGDLGEDAFPVIRLPLDVTGAGLIWTPIEGLDLQYYAYDEWALVPGWSNGVYPPYAGDLGFDFNRTKGQDFAATYNHDLWGGNLTGRLFYFDEYVDMHNLYPYELSNANNFGYGGGLIYDHNMWFAGAEVVFDTLAYKEKPDPECVDSKKNTWWGYYVMVGGKFMGGALQPVYRFDWVDYSSLKEKEYLHPPNITSVDHELWHTIALNYLVNDNATVGINYVIKQPQEMSYGGEDAKYPNINEAIIMLELDLL